MDFKAMADKAKQVFQKRGGAPAAKQDAEELRDIAQGPGSTSDKAKAAAEAIREPGANQPGSSDANPPDSPNPQSSGAGDVQQPS